MYIESSSIVHERRRDDGGRLGEIFLKISDVHAIRNFSEKFRHRLIIITVATEPRTLQSMSVCTRRGNRSVTSTDPHNSPLQLL